MPGLLGKPSHKNEKTRSRNAKSGSMVDTSRRSGLAGIYRAPRNLDQIGAVRRTGYHLYMIMHMRAHNLVIKCPALKDANL